MQSMARFDEFGGEQTLKNHLTEVSKKILGFTDNNLYGEIIGLLHDIGKYSLTLQEHVRSTSDENKPDHSSAGTQLILSLLEKRAKEIGDEEIKRIVHLIGRMISHAVAGHHSGLLNGSSVGDETSLERRPTKTLEPYLNNIEIEIYERIHSMAESLLSEKTSIISAVGLIPRAMYPDEIPIRFNLPSEYFLVPLWMQTDLTRSRPGTPTNG